VAKRSSPAKSHSKSRAPVKLSRSSQKQAPRKPVRKSTPVQRGTVGGWWSRLSNERKLDILGVVLTLLGLVTILSLLSAQRGQLTQLWVDILYAISGRGAFILPLALVLAGLWLVFRNVERIPAPSLERVVGLVLLYWNVLSWIHLLQGGGWEMANQGQGGGFLGAVAERLLVGGIGKAGTVVILLSWLLIALIFTLDVSVGQLAVWLQTQAREARHHRAANSARPIRSIPRIEETEGPVELPPDFRPLTPPARTSISAVRPSAVERAAPEASPQPASTAVVASPPQPAAKSAPVGWKLPELETILDSPTRAALQTNTDYDRARIIEETLASFGAPAHVVEIHRGPTVTQFGVEPDFVEGRSGRVRVRVGKIVALADDLALALAAPRIRIQAPVPGRNYVGIEVPNEEISRVTLREVLESEKFKKVRSSLRLALGKDVSGEAHAVDLTALPHLLIAGTTGSGKSVCVNAILCALLLYNTPADLRLVLVDPKRVELTNYNGVPHLLAPVVVEAERVISALQWMMREMDSRYQKFARNGSRNIQEFNARHPDEKLPYLVVVVDELADLMMLAPEETERSITRLAQLARATGIHLVLATQRPSVDVLTGLIKANFPARIAFTVASGVDSRVILDQPGAERLLGRGDMLFQAPDASAPVRLQGVYVSDSEIQRLVDYWRLEASRISVPQATPPIDDSLPRGVPLRQTPLWSDMKLDEGDPLLPEAIDLVRREGRASITMLQRKMRIGYTRAARLIDEMENKKIIGPALPNSQVREILDWGDAAPPAGEE